MYSDDWRPGYNPEFVRNARKKVKEREARKKKKEEAKLAAEKASEEAAKIKVAVEPSAYMPVKQIIALVAEKHGFTYSCLVGRGMKDKLVNARYEAINLVNELKPGFSSTQIGRFFNRDHTTILYAMGRVKGGSGKR